MNKLFLQSFLFVLIFLPLDLACSQGFEGPLDMDRAISLALERNPGLEAARFRKKATEGDLAQAGMLPNPELSIEVENFAGSGAQRGFRGHETTFQLRQLIETGRKRARRKEAARLRLSIADLEYQLTKMELIAQVKRAFWTALVAEERFQLGQQLVELSRQSLSAVSKRVEAGKASPMELNKAKVAAESSMIRARQLHHRLVVAKRELSYLIGYDQEAGDLRITGTLKPILELPGIGTLESALEHGPRFHLLLLQEELARASLALSRARVIPDITVGAGVRHFEESDTQALVASIDIPLPVFNRNQGSIAAQRQRLNRVVNDSSFKRLTLKSRLFSAYHALKGAGEMVQGLKERAISKALGNLEAAREGYRYGKFGYLDVLDAQRTLFQLQLEYTQALEAYYLAESNVISIIGTELFPEEKQ